MSSAIDYVNDEDEQRKRFRRFLEDRNEGWDPQSFNVKWGAFTDSTLEYMFVGWCMSQAAAQTPVDTRTIGYVKIKKDTAGQTVVDKHGVPVCMSFSAVPQDGHHPVRLV